jgi:hypothetical protein
MRIDSVAPWNVSGESSRRFAFSGEAIFGAGICGIGIAANFPKT